MIGASEVVLEKLLGGITKLGGGTLTNAALKNLDKVDNVLARFAKSAGGKLLMNAGSEALEEGLQSIIEPYLWQAVSGEEASVNWEEALYSALLGFVNGGLFEGADMAIDITAKADTGGKAIMSTDSGMDARMNLENKVAGVTSADVQNTLTNQIDKVSQQPTAGSVGQLSETVQAANNQANASVNQEDVTKSLRSKGISSQKAAGIAETIVTRLNGQELTRPQRNLLSSALNSSAVRDVISELIKKKTVGIDSAQSNVYGREGVIRGVETREEATLWDLPNQGVDVSGNDEYATVTEGSTLHQVQNAVWEGSYESGADVLDEIKRIDAIEVAFYYNSKYDETEFARQLADQQKGMKELTVQEYLENREKYIEQGRAIESNVAQQAAREKAFVDKVDELQDAGLSLKEAEEQTQRWLDTQAALHSPDQVAGGYASNVGGVGDKRVNSSIGSQWRYRIDDVDAQIQKIAESMSEAEKNSTYLNVNLTYKGD